jgi:cytochrome c6
MRTTVRLLGVATLIAGTLAFALASQEAAKAQAPGAAHPPMSLSISRGQQTFLEHCAMCHGDGGEGDGEMAGALQRKAGVAPANLTDRGRLERLQRTGVRRVIVRGGAHTGRSNLMPAWGEKLSKQQVEDVTDFVMHLPDATPFVPPATLRAYMSAPPGAPIEGRRLFVHHCAACHGSEGRGDGTFAQVLKAKRHVQPRNLTDSTYLALKSDRDLFVTVSLGGGHVGKSPYMPTWAGYLTPDQIKDLVSYIRAISHTVLRP